MKISRVVSKIGLKIQVGEVENPGWSKTMGEKNPRGF